MKDAFMRYTVEPKAGEHLMYRPNALTDAQMAEKTLKRGVLGAAYVTRFDKLHAMSSVKVLWDVEPKLEPPAHMKPLKPKLWMMGSITLEKGFFYQLG